MNALKFESSEIAILTTFSTAKSISIFVRVACFMTAKTKSYALLANARNPEISTLRILNVLRGECRRFLIDNLGHNDNAYINHRLLRRLRLAADRLDLRLLKADLLFFKKLSNQLPPWWLRLARLVRLARLDKLFLLRLTIM